MSSFESIGGFLELELREGEFPYSDGILLNSGRTCFEYILQANSVNHVYLPKYICDAMIEPLKRSKVSYSFYDIDESLEIHGHVNPGNDEFIVYVNYFGIKSDYCERISRKYKTQLILDYSQAFYSPPIKGVHTFYSPRKFFGIPDGGILYTDKKLPQELVIDKSASERFIHLCKRIEVGPEESYGDYKKNEDSLSNQPLMHMSRLTFRVLASIDYEMAYKKRAENFTILHKYLGVKNMLHIPQGVISPMVYPFLSVSSLRKKLIDRKIFVATYWPNVADWSDEGSFERRLSENIIPLPIDQRYGGDEMIKILDVINE